MVEQVSKLAGVNISHYAELNFEQFTSIVDTLGGVEVTLPVAVSDMEYSGIDLPAGTQTLNGEQALGLCRSRHAYDAYGGGDFYRSANQRMVIAAIIRKVLESDPTSWPDLISQLADSVTTDLSATEILSLANQFKDLDTENDIYSGSVPTTSQYINNLWYEVVDEDAWKTMMERTDAGETPYSDSSQDFTAGVAGSVSTSTDSSSSSDTTSTSSDPVYSGTVLVLNGTTTQGLAIERNQRAHAGRLLRHRRQCGLNEPHDHDHRLQHEQDLLGSGQGHGRCREARAFRDPHRESRNLLRQLRRGGYSRQRLQGEVATSALKVIGEGLPALSGAPLLLHPVPSR